MVMGARMNKAFCDDDVTLAFANSHLRGKHVPTVAWNDEIQVASTDTFFFATPPPGFGKQMPRLVNGKGGRANKKEFSLPNGLLRLSKYYGDGVFVVTRYRQNSTEGSICLFHIVIKEKKSPAVEAVEKVKKIVKSGPEHYANLPVFISVKPTVFETSPEKHEAIRVAGEHMTASCGRLVRLQNLTLQHGSAIYLYISNAVDNRQVTAEFNQPSDISPSTYALYLVIRDSLYKLENHLIEFTDSLQLSNLLASECVFSLMDDFDLQFYLSTPPLELHQAIELGNTRCVAQISAQHGADFPPLCAARYHKGATSVCNVGCAGGCCASVNSWVELARLSGNLCTVLFVVLWVRAALGKCTAELLQRLQQFVLSSKKLDFGEMILCLNEEDSNTANLKQAVAEIQASLQKALSQKQTSGPEPKKGSTSPTTRANPQFSPSPPTVPHTQNEPDKQKVSTATPQFSSAPPAVPHTQNKPDKQKGSTATPQFSSAPPAVPHTQKSELDNRKVRTNPTVKSLISPLPHADRSKQCAADWKFCQVFGDVSPVEQVLEVEIVSAVEFSSTGNYIAAGDKGGRVVIFERTQGNTKKSTPEYKFRAEFQSHEPEFDYLKSIEIEEKINTIKWLNGNNNGQYLLTTNDKTIKLWKVHEKKVLEILSQNIPFAKPLQNVPGIKNLRPSIQFLKIPRLQVRESIVTATSRRIYANAHAYHINALSVNSDGETYLSSDDLRINLWNLGISNQCFNIVDIKPENMEELTEVITSAEFHPQSCNIFMYSSSKGTIKLADMRAAALCDKHVKVFEEAEDPSNKSFFSEIVSSISDAKFSKDGRYILSRDYLTLKLWDIKMEHRPVKTIPIHEHLRPKLCELYENDHIFDKFECAMSGSGSQLLTGSYHNNFHIYDTHGSHEVRIEANKYQSKLNKSSLKKKGKNKEDPDVIDFSKKALHVAWHPREDLIAVAASGNLYLYAGEGVRT